MSDGGDDRSGVRCNGGRWMGMMRKGSWEDDSNVHRLDRRGQLFGLKSRDLSQFFGLSHLVGPQYGACLGPAQG